VSIPSWVLYLTRFDPGEKRQNRFSFHPEFEEIMKLFSGKKKTPPAPTATPTGKAGPGRYETGGGLYGGGPKHRTLSEELRLHRRSTDLKQQKKLHSDRKKTKTETEREIIPLLFLFKWICIAAIGLAGLWVLRSWLNNINDNRKEELKLAKGQVQALERQLVDQPTFDFENQEQVPFLIRNWKTALEESAAADNLLRWQADKEAMARLHKALQSNPEHQKSRIMIAEICMRQGDYRRAVNLLIHILNSDPSSPSAKLMLAQAFEALEHHEAARRIADWIVAVDPRNLDALQIASRVKLKLNDLNGALKDFERVVSLDEANQTALEGMAEIQFKRGNLSEIIPLYNRLIQLSPDRQLYYYRLAAAHAQQENPIQAVIAMELAVSRFGEGQVRGWLSDSPFDPIRENHLFRGFFDRVASESQKKQQLVVQKAEARQEGEGSAPSELRKIEFGMERLERDLFKPSR